MAFVQGSKVLKLYKRVKVFFQESKMVKIYIKVKASKRIKH